MTRATILTGLGGGLLVVLLLAPATGNALGELARARSARAEATALAATSRVTLPPLVAPALHIRAPGEAAAARVVADRIRALAAQTGVLVERTEARRGATGLTRMRLRISGSDKAVVALIDQLEREAPLVRLRRWQVTALDGAHVRLDGEAVAAWR